MSLLRARALRVSYGAREVLHGVDLELAPGEVVAVVGPNGSGKSSLLRAFAGVLAPSGGDVLLQGRSLSSYARVEVARSIAVVPQQVPSAPGFTVREVVAMGRAPHQDGWLRERREDADAIERALARCELLELAPRPFDRLSGGERKRALVAQALAQGAPVLLLDEASASLDLRQSVALFELARQEAAAGRAVCAIVHDLALAARFSDRVALLVEGVFAASGPPGDVLSEERLRAAFGVPVMRFGDASAGAMAFALGRRPG